MADTLGVNFDKENCIICDMKHNQIQYELFTGILMGGNFSGSGALYAEATAVWSTTAAAAYYPYFVMGGGGSIGDSEEAAQALFGFINGFLGFIVLFGIILWIIFLIFCCCGGICLACGMRRRKTTV